MRGNRRPGRTTWDALNEGALSSECLLRKSELPHRRWLEWPGGGRTQVTFSTDMRWYRLSTQMSSSEGIAQMALGLARKGFILARPTCDAAGLHLRADIPAASAEALSGSLALWQADCRHATSLVVQGMGQVDDGEVPPAAAAEADAIRALEAFLRDVGASWQVTQDGVACLRLVRGRTASRKLPPVCQLSTGSPVTSVVTTIPLDGASATDGSLAARSLFLLRANSGQHVASRLLHHGDAELRGALPTLCLQPAHLRTVFDALVEAHQSCALELQALGEDALAALYLRLQGYPSLVQTKEVML